MKNYLGKTKKVKAPLKWQSSADSPPTQLAYVTQPEIDMLVKANIHGSMKGQPNMGPSGILSLNGGTPQDAAYDEAVDKSGNESAIDSYYNSPQGQKESKTSDSAQQIINKVSNWQKDTNQGGQNIKTSQKQQKKHTQDIYDKWKKDGKSVTEDKVVEKPKKEEKTFYIDAKVGKVSKRLYDYYQNIKKKLGHEEAAKRVLLKKMEEEWADKNLVDLRSGEGIKRLVTKDFGASKKYEHEFLGSAGAANILNQLEKIKGKTDKETAQLKQNYVNQIIEANPEGAEKMGLSNYQVDSPSGWNISPEIFEQKLVDANQGNKNFDQNYHKTVGAYWDVNTPQTLGDQESMANAFQQGNLKMTKANTLAIQQAVDAKSRMEDASNVGLSSIGGEQPATDPIDPTDPDKPYGNLTFDVYGRPITNYDYTGGPEQLYLGGGWKKDDKYIGSPWGPNPPEVWGHIQPFKEGGIANFKPYGY